jgi:hypothetical protein
MDQGGSGHPPPGPGAPPPGLWVCTACHIDFGSTRELFFHVSQWPCSRDINETLEEFKANFRRRQKEASAQSERDRKLKFYHEHAEQERERKRKAHKLDGGQSKKRMRLYYLRNKNTERDEVGLFEVINHLL